MSHPISRRRRRNRPLVLALYVNAALLAAVLVAVLSRGTGGTSAAYAAPAGDAPQPIAGGNGLYLMPGQFSQNVWGCYVMDTNRRTLLAYEYVGGTRSLRLVAARGYEQDLNLRKFNTFPPVEEVERLVQMEKAGVRGVEKPANEKQPGDAPAGDGPKPPPADPEAK
ncbi:MAG TPA: hypothetical protein VF796_08960 [Humisphaera sp.]